jgi:hypothetical protein
MVDDCCYLWDLEAGLITNRDDHLCGEYSSEVLAIWEVDSGSRLVELVEHDVGRASFEMDNTVVTSCENRLQLSNFRWHAFV